MIRDFWHVSVLVPARNEESLLARCLRSVLRACQALPSNVTCDIIVVVDSSTDRTREIAEKLLASDGAVFCIEAGIVGKTRAAAAEAAFESYRGPLDRHWLAHTDADSEVPSDWLLEQLILAESGVRAVAGTVDVDSFAEHSHLVPRRFRQSYQIDDDGSHPHVHGANLGVRADLYRLAGGWREISTGEDHDLWSRIKEVDPSCRSCSHFPVITSGRRQGRAPAGFADALAAHNEPAA
jgi:glycosyltransferase involved in cell wall biosynthesis